MPPLIQVADLAAGPPSSVTHPLTGRPSADLTLSRERVPWQPGDQVEVKVDQGHTYRMTVLRVGPRGGFARVRLVGGTGGLSKDIPARFYRDIPAETVLREILQDAGEEVGEVSLPGELPCWVRPTGPAHEALRALMMRYPERVWRMDPEGKVHVEAPKWPDHPEPIPIESEDAALGIYRCQLTRRLLPGEAATLTRGEEQLHKRVTRVTHLIEREYDYPRPQIRLRTLVGTGDGADSGVSGLETAVHQATRWTDYLAVYPCEVLRDHGNHTLDLRPEHPLMPELTEVRLAQPLPGARVKLKAGGVVVLSFQAGDPARPVVLHYGDCALELLEVVTGRGQVLRLEDDRGRKSPDDRRYQRPHVRLQDAAGQSVELWAEPGAERVTVRDRAGQQVELRPAAGSVTVRANTTVNVQGGQTVNISASNAVTVTAAVVNVNGGTVALAGGGSPVARVGDQVAGIDAMGTPFTGTIISGSPRVTSG